MTDQEQLMSRIEPVKDKVIMCLAGAADMLGLTNQGYLETLEVYAEKEYNLPNTKVIVLPGCFGKKEVVQVRGCYCTSEEQTLMDLMDNADTVDVQVLLESLSKYYYTHDESFDPLEGRLNHEQMRILNEYEMDAVYYYDDGDMS